MPYYDGLTIKDIVSWAQDIDEGKVLEYLPTTSKEILKMPRSYIGNIVFTVLG